MRIRVLVGVCLLLILVCLPPSERGQETPAGGDFGEIHFAEMEQGAMAGASAGRATPSKSPPERNFLNKISFSS